MVVVHKEVLTPVAEGQTQSKGKLRLNCVNDRAQDVFKHSFKEEKTGWMSSMMLTLQH